MPAKNATFKVRLISGGRITIPTAIRELLRLRDGDYFVCSVRAAENEELPPLKTLWRILRACRKGLTSKEIVSRCRLSARTSGKYIAMLVDEELLSASGARESNAGGETYRTTEKGCRIIDLVAPIRGGSR